VGLSIHWEFGFDGTVDEVKQKLELMREKAVALGFKEVGTVHHVVGKDCEYEPHRDKDDGLFWALIQAQGYVRVDEYGKPLGDRESYAGCCHLQVTPVEVVVLDTWPGDGCEAANFGLARYGKTVKFSVSRFGPEKDVPTGLGDGWHWRSFCKTQYANEYGIMNFLSCHRMVIGMLDYAKELGILKEVNDEGEYWEKRDVNALVKTIGEWDQFIAAFAGQLQKAVAPTGMELVSAITSRQDFEHLEMQGLERMKDKLPGFVTNMESVMKMIEKQVEQKQLGMRI
jgi:hypothetical protein